MKNQYRKFAKIFISACVLGLGVFAAQAQLSVYEGFNYATGTSIEAFTATGFGWNTEWRGPAGNSENQASTTTPLAYLGLSVTGNYMSHPGYSERINRQFTVPVSLQNANGFIGKTGTSVYLSYLFRKNSNTASWYGNGPVVQLIKYSNQNDYDAELNKLGVGVFGDETVFQILGGANNSGDRFNSSTAFALSTTYFVVVKYTFAATSTTVDVFINPSVTAAEPTATFSSTFSKTYEFDAVYFGLGNGSNQGNIDEIHVGDTWNEVTPDDAVATALTSVSITGVSTISTDGGELDLTYIAFPANATLPLSAKWSISDSKIAALMASGKLTAIKNGTINITLEVGNLAGASVTTTSSVTISGQVENAASLLAYEGFDMPANTTLVGTGLGFGWANNWEADGSFEEYITKNDAPLSFSSLSTTGNYLDVGRPFNNIQRNIDLATAFSGYASNGSLAKQGQTYWFSALYQVNEFDYSQIALSNNPAVANTDFQNNSYLGFGYYGNDSKTGGVDYLTLRYKSSSDIPSAALEIGDVIVQTSTVLELGKTNFVVMKVTIGGDRSDSYLDYYINPPLGTEPVNSAYSFVLTAVPNIKRLILGGNNAPSASFDEFRIGTTFSSVTPSAQVLSISILGNTISQFAGTSTLSVTAIPSNADKNVVWSVSNGAVASISGSGILSALTNGIVTVTATAVSNGIVGNSVFTITGQAPTSVTVSPATGVTSGDNITFTGTALPANAAQGITWSVSNTSLASIGASTGVFVPNAQGVVTVTGTSSVDASKFGMAVVTITQLNVKTIALSGGNISTYQGVRTVTASVLPSGATDKSVTWAISNTVVATINNSGVITALTNGIVSVTATSVSNPSISGSLNVTISGQAPTSISITPSVGTITSSTLALSASVLPVLASNAITWSSSDNAIATVSGTGVVRAIAKMGEVTITATSAVSGTVFGTATIKINIPVALTGVTVSGVSSLIAGQTSTFTTNFLPSNASGTVNVIWSVSNATIATVDASGLLTSLKQGSVTLTAKATNGVNTVTGTKIIVVNALPLGSYFITLTSSSAIIDANGGSLMLTPVVQPAGITVSGFAWSSSDASVATVVDGIVQAVGNGVVTITATSLDVATISGMLEVTVSNQELATSASELSNKVSLYPNPASEVLNVAVNGVSILNLEIINSVGSVVYSQVGGSSSIGLAGFAKGLYVVKILTDKGLVAKSVSIN